MTASLTEHKISHVLLLFFTFFTCGIAAFDMLPYLTFILQHLPLLIARLLSLVRSV